MSSECSRQTDNHDRRRDPFLKPNSTRQLPIECYEARSGSGWRLPLLPSKDAMRSQKLGKPTPSSRRMSAKAAPGHLTRATRVAPDPDEMGVSDTESKTRTRLAKPSQGATYLAPLLADCSHRKGRHTLRPADWPPALRTWWKICQKIFLPGAQTKKGHPGCRR